MSMDEYILEDHLKPDEVRLVKEMLNAVVNHSDAFNNSFTVERTGLHAHIRGYQYYLSPKGGATSPFRNKQVLPEDFSLVLFDLKFVETERGHNKSGSWFSFTNAALEWHRQYGGPDANEIRKRIGRILYREAGGGRPKNYQSDDIAQEIGSTRERVKFEAEVLRRAGFIEHRYKATSNTDLGNLMLTEPKGIVWATGGFQPIGDRIAQSVSVNVALQIEVKTIIEQARSADIPAELRERFEARIRRLEEELEKPEGEGNFEKVKDLVETANTSRELLGSIIPLLARHWDKIQSFADAAGTIIGPR
jgi:hypothetical protein